MSKRNVQILVSVLLILLLPIMVVLNRKFILATSVVDEILAELDEIAIETARVKLTVELDPEAVSHKWNIQEQYSEALLLWLNRSELRQLESFIKTGSSIPGLRSNAKNLTRQVARRRVSLSTVVEIQVSIDNIRAEIFDYRGLLGGGYSHLVQAQFILIGILILIVIITMEIRYRQDAVIADSQRIQSEVVLALEEERNRIALDLHDDIAQELSWLRMTIERKDSRLDQTTLLDGIVARVRNLSRTLRTPDFTLESFHDAISDLIEITEQRSDVRVRYLPGQIAPSTYANVYGHVYRIFQESLNNSGKHAGACTVFIEIQEEESFLYGEYRDTGKGFDTNAPELSKRLGLRGIRNRISILGGNIDIETIPEEGTRIIFQIPLGQKE